MLYSSLISVSLSNLSSMISSIDRKQMVKVNGELSASKEINIGVRQGSVLGPLLFLNFINSLPTTIPNAKFTLIADDTLGKI